MLASTQEPGSTPKFKLRPGTGTRIVDDAPPAASHAAADRVVVVAMSAVSVRLSDGTKLEITDVDLVRSRPRRDRVAGRSASRHVC